MQSQDRADELIGLHAATAPLVDLPSAEEDPELEREFQELAQWLLDVYLWKLHEERKARAGEKNPAQTIDNGLPPVRMEGKVE
jgi:hypothetical protein